MSANSPRSQHILVDMTPLEGNGQNGGAGVVAKSLVRHLSELAPDWRFTLLTSERSHAELSPLDRSNVRRECVVGQPGSPTVVRHAVDRLLPLGVRAALKQAYWSRRASRRYARTAASRTQADALLCPFTVPYFWQSGIPCVSIVYDLQHLAYPTFFTPEQRLNRQRHIGDACRRSERVVCISAYVRGTLIAAVDVGAERVSTIPLALLRDHGSADPATVPRLGLTDADFLLYPANFWPHKNHRVLFEAVAIHLRAYPESPLKLVCTGAPNALMRELQDVAASILPAGTVQFPGYLGEHELAALFQACAALIFPSLYEGFGMPVLEAMACGKPVLCSNTTSLPEVAGDAAIFFDPTDPHDIAQAIAALGDRTRVTRLVRRGRERAECFGTAERMAMDYLAILRSVQAPRVTLI